MKAARYYAANDIRVEEVDEPVAGETKALVAVEWAGICGSDLHEYTKGPSTIPRPGHPHPISGESLPVIMGHEFSGRILKAPPGSSLKEGQAVMVDPRLNCGSCEKCAADYGYSCSKWGFLGLSGSGGGFSEAVAVEPRMIHVLPDSIPLDVAPLIEPLAVAWHGARISAINDFKGVPILILGGGPVGVAVSYVLRAKGADQIYASEPAEKRQEAMKPLVDSVIDPVKEKLVERCLELTGGKGVRVVFDCAGVQAAFNDAFASLAFKGVYVNLAGWNAAIMVHPGPLMLREITLVGSMAYSDSDFKETITALAEGKLKGVEKMITARIDLKDIVEKGFMSLIENREGHIKIFVTPKPEGAK